MGIGVAPCFGLAHLPVGLTAVGAAVHRVRPPGGQVRNGSTASQTAWALLGLMAVGEVDNPAVERGVQYLSRTQTANALWDEERFTATGFPRVFYLRYHGYPKYFPLWALARYRNLRRTNIRRIAHGM